MLTSKEFGRNYISFLTKIVIHAHQPEYQSHEALLNKLAGSPSTATIARRVFYWVQHTTRADGMFYKKAGEMAAECGITQKAVERAAMPLKKMGIVRVVRRAPDGSPTTHYGLDVDQLLMCIARMLNISFYGLQELLTQETSAPPAPRQPQPSTRKTAIPQTVKKVLVPDPDPSPEPRKPMEPIGEDLLNELLELDLPLRMKLHLQKRKMEYVTLAETNTTHYQQEIKQETTGIKLTTQQSPLPVGELGRQETGTAEVVVGSYLTDGFKLPDDENSSDVPAPAQPQRYGQWAASAEGHQLTWEQIESIGTMLKTPPQLVNTWIKRYTWKRFDHVVRAALYDSNIRDRGAWVRQALEDNYHLSEARMSKDYIPELYICGDFISSRIPDPLEELTQQLQRERAAKLVGKVDEFTIR